MIVDFIDTQRAEGHAVESICAVLTSLGAPIAARTYRDVKARRGPSKAALRLAYLMNDIHTLAFTRDVRSGEHRMLPAGLYGRRKMTALLARTGTQASYERVHLAMKALGHNGVRRTKKVRTTVPNPGADRAPDLLKRDFTAKAPNHVWVTDFTYVRTWAGFAYVAFIVDVYAQRIVAWHAAMSKHADLVMIPLRMALWERDREAHPPSPHELIHHSDAGSQYTSLRLSEHLALQDILPSIGTVGDAYDNALMESINGLYKAECIRSTVFGPGEREYKTLLDVELATSAWVQWWNTERLHSSIAMRTPLEHEAAYYDALTQTEQTPV